MGSAIIEAPSSTKMGINNVISTPSKGNFDTENAVLRTAKTECKDEYDVRIGESDPRS